MRIRDRVRISTVDKEKSVEVQALFDTGARSTYISEEIGEKLGFRRLSVPRKVPLAAKGREADIIGSDTYFFTIADCEMPEPVGVNVVKDLAEEAIIGTDFMEKFNIYLDLKEGKAKLKKCPPEVVLI